MNKTVKKLFGPTFLLAAASALAQTTPPSSLNLYFQNWSVGSAYSQSMATTDWKQLKFWDTNIYATIKQYDATNDYRALRIKMPKDQFNGATGMTWVSNLANSSDYTFEYKVFFEPGFEFNRGNVANVYGGGKLPGLAGGSQPSGGAPTPDGMSARIMFRRDPTRTNPYIELYQYWRGQSGTYADSIYLQDVTENRWYTIKMRVELGTTTTDGRVRVWVNGTLMLDRAYRYLASGQTWQLNGIFQHAFMGGNEASWAPTKDTYLMLDNMRVSNVTF